MLGNWERGMAVEEDQGCHEPVHASLQRHWEDGGSWEWNVDFFKYCMFSKNLGIYPLVGNRLVELGKETCIFSPQEI